MHLPGPIGFLLAGLPLGPHGLCVLREHGSVLAFCADLGKLLLMAVAAQGAELATVLGKAFLLPLALGMLLRAVAPTLSERFADRAVAIAGVVLTLAGLTLLVTHWQLFIEVRWQGMVALVVLLLAVAIGHSLGGPHPDDRTALAVACATRHIGVAVIVATAFRGPRTMVLLASYVVASAAVAIPYLQWRRRQARGQEPIAGGE